METRYSGGSPMNRRILIALLPFLLCFWFHSGPIQAQETYPAGKKSPKKGTGSIYLATPELVRALGLSWGYNWNISGEKYFQTTHYEHVPMLHAEDLNNIPEIQRLARAFPGRYWLFFNEPDYYRQDNLAPNHAAEVYYRLRKALKEADPTAKCIVGGVLWPQADWMTGFREEYRKRYGAYPEVEGWHVHHYVDPANYNPTEWRRVPEFWRNWMNNNGGPRELWLTEFGCLTSDSVGMQIMQDQIPWLESQPWITRYAWFNYYIEPTHWFKGTLTLPGGKLSALGQLYATFGNESAPSFTITANAGSGGTISPSGRVNVPAGGSQTFTITPSVGYQIADVKVDGVSEGAIRSKIFHRVSSNHTLTATFAAVSSSISNPSSNGSESPAVRDTGTPSAGAQIVREASTSGGNFVWAMNCGGPSYPAKDGIVYRADEGANGGRTYQTSSPIEGTTDPILYQSERWGNFSYRIPLANGNYTVTLKFAEIYENEAGRRLFHVKIEGKEVLSKFDIFFRAGKNRAYDLQFPVMVADGALDIEFYSAAGDAKVNAILVSSTEGSAQSTNAATTSTTRSGGSAATATTTSGGENSPSTSTTQQTGIASNAGISSSSNRTNPNEGLTENPSGSPTSTLASNHQSSAIENPQTPTSSKRDLAGATVVDLDGDGRDDVIWLDESPGPVFAWYFKGDRFGRENIQRDVGAPNWKMAGGGNLRRDGSYHIFWKNVATGEVYAWSMNRGSYLGEHYITTVEDLRWKLAGVGDFDGDGNVDLLWHHQEFGLVYIWFMKGVNFIRDQYVATVEDVRWQVVGVGDLNGDGKAEVLWQHPEGGPLYIWYMDGARWLRDQYVRSVEDLNWKVVGIGRFSDSRQANILWKHQVSGEVYIWFLENGVYLGDARMIPSAGNSKQL